MLVQVGTSGFSYPGWRGAFYPERLPAAEFLAHYATRLGTVELNNTFYRMPSQELVESWVSQVPPGFSFAVKASRGITHIARLERVEVALERFVERCLAFGDRLGCALFQLPPQFKRDEERLGRFLEQLAGRVPAAFEFRHTSWYEDGVLDLLRAHGAALCIGDPEKEERVAPFVATARFTYARMRRESYSPAELADWAARVRSLDVDRAWVFFKHEILGPEWAEAFAKYAALER